MTHRYPKARWVSCRSWGLPCASLMPCERDWLAKELPHIDYLSCYKKNSLCSVLELNVGPGGKDCAEQNFGIFIIPGAASAVLYRNHSASKPSMTNMMIGQFSAPASHAPPLKPHIRMQSFPVFSTAVVSRSTRLPWERWHAGNEGVKALTATLWHPGCCRSCNTRSLLPCWCKRYCVHRSGWVDWELRRAFYETKRSPPTHLCRIVIVFLDIWWCPEVCMRPAHMS